MRCGGSVPAGARVAPSPSLFQPVWAVRAVFPQGLMRWNLSSVSVANFLGQSKWKAEAIIQVSEVNVCFPDLNTWKATSTILWFDYDDLDTSFCLYWVSFSWPLYVSVCVCVYWGWLSVCVLVCLPTQNLFVCSSKSCNDLTD